MDRQFGYRSTSPPRQPLNHRGFLRRQTERLPHPTDELVHRCRILRGEIHVLRHADTLFADSSFDRPYRVAPKTSRIVSAARTS
jgi:hypothetical protein